MTKKFRFTGNNYVGVDAVGAEIASSADLKSLRLQYLQTKIGPDDIFSQFLTGQMDFIRRK